MLALFSGAYHRKKTQNVSHSDACIQCVDHTVPNLFFIYLFIIFVFPCFPDVLLLNLYGRQAHAVMLYVTHMRLPTPEWPLGPGNHASPDLLCILMLANLNGHQAQAFMFTIAHSMHTIHVFPEFCQ